MVPTLDAVWTGLHPDTSHELERALAVCTRAKSVQVFRNGELLVDYSFSSIRDRAKVLGSLGAGTM